MNWAHLKIISKKMFFTTITETCLTDHNDCAFNIDGYTTFYLHKSDQPGGGIKLYYSIEIKASIIPYLTTNHGPCEILFIHAKFPNLGTITIGPPDKKK